MEGANNRGGGVGRVPRRADNRRRIWSHREEESLVTSLKEIISEGWKCENGFRTGYLTLLEKHMLRILPGTDLRADPHINSKIHVWKKTYGSLFSMLARSGFGWDAKSNMIIMESEDVWDNYVKTDTFAKSLRYKSHPFYAAWSEILGRDRATGEHAVDCNDAANDYTIPVDNDVPPENVSFNEHAPTTDDDAESMSVCRSSPNVSATSKKTNSKKQKSADGFEDDIVRLMDTFCTQSNDRLGDIAQRIGYEFDLGKKRTVVYELLSGVGDLTMKKKIWLAKTLVNNNQDLDLFFSLPDDARMEFIGMMLAGHFVGSNV